MSLIEDLKYQFRTGGSVIKLIYINVIIYLFFTVLWVISKLIFQETKHVLWLHDLFSMNCNGFETVKHFWGVFTYMFLHAPKPIDGFWHILFNMLILYFSGRLFEDLLGSKKLITTYIIGGLSGGVLHFFSVNYLPGLSERLIPFALNGITEYKKLNELPLVGASASVAAILTAIGLYRPKYEVFLFRVLRVKLIYIAVFYIFFEFIRLPNIDGTSHFAHFGGALWAFFYINNLKKGKDISSWFNQLTSIVNSIFKKKKIKIVYKKKNPIVKKTSNRSQIRQEKVDAILDKIKVSGYESLSKEEKDYLFDASKNI